MLFKDLLTRSNSALEGKRAERMARGAKSAHDDIMKSYVKKLDEIEIEIETMEDMSVSNDMQNAARVQDFDGDKWIKRYDDLHQQKELLKAKMKVSNAVHTKLFGESYLNSTSITLEEGGLNETLIQE